MIKWIFVIVLSVVACVMLPSKLDVSSLKSVSVYKIDAFLGTPQLTSYLTSALPAIKNTGFDALWLPAFWYKFDPNPLTQPRLYNTEALNDARDTFIKLRAAHMKAFVGLNYVGVGFAPDFGSVLPPDQACNWAVNPITYAAFETYVEAFLNAFQDFSDVLIPLVFTENSEGCGQATQAAAPAVAIRLQGTLGSLPTRLPKSLRDKFTFGYHDYTIINLGWGNGLSPIASPTVFDFVSMVAYGVASTDELNVRANRFTTLYPKLPLFLGEFGASACGVNPPQLAHDTLAVNWALANKHGFSLWGWPNAGADECTNLNYGGLSITNPDGTPNATAAAIRDILK